MGCCGAGGVNPAGQNFNVARLNNNRTTSQSAQNANVSIPPELAAFIQQLGLGS